MFDQKKSSENTEPLSAGHLPAERISTVTGIRRVLYLLLAGIFFGLGMLGVILPGLPTTPFLLLTSYFLVRSFPALNERMLNSRIVGPILRDWQKHRGVRLHIKVKTIAIIFICIASTAYLGNFSPLMLGSIVGLSAIGMLIVLRLPIVED